jgi:hypothetical protein
MAAFDSERMARVRCLRSANHDSPLTCAGTMVLALRTLKSTIPKLRLAVPTIVLVEPHTVINYGRVSELTVTCAGCLGGAWLGLPLAGTLRARGEGRAEPLASAKTL